MKKTIMLGLCVVAAMALQAQLVTVVKCNRVQTGFYPVLNADGTKMLLTAENYAGLSVYDVAAKQLQTLTLEANAGYQPTFNADNSKVFYRSKSYENGRGLTAVKSYALATQKAQTLISPRREVGTLKQYGNGVVFCQEKQLRKATFGKNTMAAPVYVSNEDLKLVLYNNGKRTELHPYAEDVNYIWSSVSPDGTKILFNTKYGTAICDLEGRILANLGNLNAPVWYNNDLVLGMFDKDNGDVILSSDIAMMSADGKQTQILTDGSTIAMYPSASAQAGKIAYNTQDGQVYLMEITTK